jgi:hypothetical protein
MAAKEMFQMFFSAQSSSTIDPFLILANKKLELIKLRFPFLGEKS